MPRVFRVLNRYELEPIHRGGTSFTFVIEILRELDRPDPALRCRVYRKEFFQLQPSSFREDNDAKADYTDEELLVEDSLFDVDEWFANEQSALTQTIKKILEALGGDPSGQES